MAPHDAVTNQAFWDDRYRSSSALWSGQPNPHLVSEAVDLVAGVALDVGCGEGADAIWLAERGWQVTALDLSTVALERGEAQALERGADMASRITWLHADLGEWVPPAARYDLVSVQFMHLPTEPRQALFRRLSAAVAPGGFLLIVGHHPSDLQTTAKRPRSADLLFTAGDVAAGLDAHGWEVIVSAARERDAVDPDGRAVTVHDAVLSARRHE
ncbi:MAG TPA: class I SAM-dependent methyltransferase [Acidimicrobiales bacterium]|nr:class I SAM-dependent methyltransferase [Acidimicrobiales bacterium]